MPDRIPDKERSIDGDPDLESALAISPDTIAISGYKPLSCTHPPSAVGLRLKRQG